MEMSFCINIVLKYSYGPSRKDIIILTYINIIKWMLNILSKISI